MQFLFFLSPVVYFLLWNITFAYYDEGNTVRPSVIWFYTTTIFHWKTLSNVFTLCYLWYSACGCMPEGTTTWRPTILSLVLWIFQQDLLALLNYTRGLLRGCEGYFCKSRGLQMRHVYISTVSTHIDGYVSAHIIETNNDMQMPFIEKGEQFSFGAHCSWFDEVKVSQATNCQPPWSTSHLWHQCNDQWTGEAQTQVSSVRVAVVASVLKMLSLLAVPFGSLMSRSLQCIFFNLFLLI